MNTLSALPYPFLVNPQLVLDVAMGLTAPEEIVGKYQLNWDTWLSLREDPAFTSQVESKKAELKREGHTFRAKCALAGEDLIPDIYLAAKLSYTPLNLKLEAAKFFAKMGGLEPRENREALMGAGFSVTIDMGDGKSITIGAKAPEPIDVTPEELPNSIEDAPFELPFLPRGEAFRLPDNFPIWATVMVPCNNELSYNP